MPRTKQRGEKFYNENCKILKKPTEEGTGRQAELMS